MKDKSAYSGSQLKKTSGYRCKDCCNTPAPSQTRPSFSPSQQPEPTQQPPVEFEGTQPEQQQQQQQQQLQHQHQHQHQHQQQEQPPSYVPSYSTTEEDSSTVQPVQYTAFGRGGYRSGRSTRGYRGGRGSVRRGRRIN
eukprot:TRINITY_DN1645_c0_g1_i3.p1 TRINITY_DN1645_c0_g1~~TRINITY_DN1645_c0_g1_i3.p1  ORF type:complete len:138 (+),score=50.08 TRINITY_DN1645_c0_g1_i3:483-896(+)